MSSPDDNSTLNQAGRYGAAGIINTVLGYGLIFALQALGASPYIANAVGYGVGFVISFFLQKRFVFGSSGRTSNEAIRFVVAFLAAYSANFFMLYVLLTAGINPYLAQIGGFGTYFVAMFLISKVWVFRQ